jgi:phage repressor protein C with HTH and peptisase S24 domain
MSVDPRANLERLCIERRQDFASLSRMLGRNSAYIHQFVRRGVPKRLKEDERRILADFFDVDETVFGGPPPSVYRNLVPVLRVPLKIPAGHGTTAEDWNGTPYFAFEPNWLKQLTRTQPNQLSIVQVIGDSMVPTLNEGDDILVDPGNPGDRIRDGIYVLRNDNVLVVKRVAVNPIRGTVTVQSDNPAYADWPDCEIDSLAFIGRVIWAARKVV